MGHSPDNDIQIVRPFVSYTHLQVTPIPIGWTAKRQGHNDMLVNRTVTREAFTVQGARAQLGDVSRSTLGFAPVVSGNAPQADVSNQPRQMDRPTPSAPSAPFIPSQPGVASAPQTAPPQCPADPPPAATFPAQVALVPQAMASASSAATHVAPPGRQAPPSLSSAGSGTFPTSCHALKSFRVTSSGTIGCASGNTLVLDDPLISKYHAQIDVSSNGVVITGLGPTNSLYVTGQRVSQVQAT